MRVRLLGPVDVVVDGVGRPVSGRRRKAVLAVLALHSGRVVGAERIIDLVWGDEAPVTAANTLQSHISYLRRVLGAKSAIVARAPGYLLDLGAEVTDVQAAERLIQDGATSTDPADSVRMLRAALALWRGQALADVGGLGEEVQRLDRLRMRADKALAEARLALGEHEQLVEDLELLARDHPLDEQLHGQLMVALYRSGRQADALATYRGLRQILDAELGIEPSRHLRDLEGAVLRQDTALDGPTTPIVKVVPAQLPLAVQAFVGRTAELAWLDAVRAESNPIAVVCGTAGVGKTTLAVRWAHRIADRFPDGQLYLNLRGYDPEQRVSPADALAGFLRALGVAGPDIPLDRDERAARYRTALAGRRVLVILDNAGSVDQVRPLLPGTAGCAAVVTSRDSLAGLVALDGALRLDLDLLPLADAVTLLGRLIGARVPAEPAAAEELAGQCARLPLALRAAAELAAAQPDSSLAGLAKELGDRQRQGKEADCPPGQRVTSLREAVGLWRGRPLSGLSGAWVARMRETWLQERVTATVAWAHAEADAGGPATVLGPLADLAAEHPLVEPLTAAPMRMQAILGHTAEALRQYEGARRRLAEELGIDPGPELRSVHQAVLRGQFHPPARTTSPIPPRSPGPAVVPPAATENLPPALLPADFDVSPGPSREPAASGSGASASAVALAGVLAPHTGPRAAALPPSLTPLVGRHAERAALMSALGEHRLVTAVGPGGIGKTRLALACATELTGRFADGAWYVDLVPVTDGGMVAPAVAHVLGLGEQLGRSPEDAVLAWLANREALLVLDNCEHLVDGVAVLLERLLTKCPRVGVLATSRTRLLVPYERVYAVPGMSVLEDAGDAVDLFLARAAASGGLGFAVDLRRVAAICHRLDGMALAIELAAARLPALGLDGLEAGLADQLRLLTGGHRIDNRHRSLRSALDWSHALLTDAQGAVLRRVSVFAAPFTAPDAAALLAGWPPVEPAEVAAALAALPDQSLMVAVADPDATRYRVLETIRQYGVDRLNEMEEMPEAHNRHLRWCLATADALGASFTPDAGWRVRFDRIVDELRAALGWAAAEPERRADGYRLAVRLAEVCFMRGLPAEAQRRYEQAAGLAADDRQAADALHSAAEAAKARHAGIESLRLHRAAADAALRAGDRPQAAYDLAQLAEMINRGPGLMSKPVPPSEAERAIAEATTLAGDDKAARARILVAEAFAKDGLDPVVPELLDRAVTLSREAGDPLGESAALDQLTSVHLARGEIRAAVATALRRPELLERLPMRVDTSGLELSDAYFMAAETAIAAGDLASARLFAERIQDLPFHREEGHLATGRLLVVTALAGEWDETVELSERFREGWERADRPTAGNLSRGPCAVAMVYGLRGDEAARDAWLRVADALSTPGRPASDIRHGEFFHALVLLHRGHLGEAVELLACPPEEFRAWHNGLWRTWYAALWAEAAVLAGRADAADRLTRAHRFTMDNPIALSMVERSAALAAGDRDGLLSAAERLRLAGCRYQWARTLVLAGGPERIRGEDELAAMGATPMSTAAPQW